jgi:hypothetical protein
MLKAGATIEGWSYPSLPMTARLLAPSVSARDQSIFCASESLAINNCWRIRHSPDRCHSRSRRQQLIPLPQLSSCGRSSQAIPVFRTKRIPVSALRLSRGLRPGKRDRLGLGGKNGAIRPHNASSMIGLAMCVPPILSSAHGLSAKHPSG